MTENLQQVQTMRRKPLSWLWKVYLLFAAFLILDGCFYLLSPYSGRVSRLVCKPIAADQSRCTVTIYGFRQVYRRSFPADAFDEALVIHNYTGDSADTTYGITLLTETGKIGFIHPYQNHSVIQQTADQINALFLDGVPAPDISITFIGFNWGLYLRLLLLAFGLLFVLHRSRKSREKSALMPAGNPVGYPAGHPSFWRYAWRWFRNNLLVRVSFYLVILIIMLSGCSHQYSLQTDLIMGCYFIPQTRQGFFDWSWGYLLCFYPLLVLLLLKALVQRRMLSMLNFHTSLWWVLAPFVATPLAIVIAPQLYCDDCLTLKYLMAGIVAIDSPLMIGLAVYFLGLGVIQWLAMRKILPGSWGWVIMPLVSAMLVVPVMIGYRAWHIAYWHQLSSYQRQISIRYLALYLPGLIILLAILISEIIPALYVSWLAARKTRQSQMSEFS